MSNSSLVFALAALKKAITANERIDNLPLPMIFKGTLGTGGTIETLPTASTENEGFVYIVITDGTYAGQSAKAGDTFVSDGSSWVLVPSADEPSPIDDSVISTALTWSSDKIVNELGGVVKTLTYTGNGQNTNEITFPEKPLFILSIFSQHSASGITTAASFGYGIPYTFVDIGSTDLNNAPSTRTVNLTYNDKVISVEGATAERSLNRNNSVYTVYYI